MNKNPEQNLIDKFRSLLKGKDNDFSVDIEINFNCKAHKKADIEYISKSGDHFVIEAKSHHSKDAYNSVHKLFGELLKETGRLRDTKKIKYGILIPKDEYNEKNGITFYRECFRKINRTKFIEFGKLIPMSYVFVCSQESSYIDIYTWANFYEGKKPDRTIQNIDKSV